MHLKPWKPIFVIASLFFFLGTLTQVSAQSSYNYERPITIRHTQIPNTNQTNLPVLISGTYSYLATTNNGGNVTNSNGYDIIFTLDAAGTNILPFEQESYSASTGAVNYWVKVPTLSHTTDTIIYLFYGNSSITSDQSNRAGTWDSNYVGVWHLPNGTTLSAIDSTSNGHNGTISGATATSGEIGGGADFSGSTDAIALGNSSSFYNTSFTVSAWINPSSYDVTYGRILKKAIVATYLTAVTNWNSTLHRAMIRENKPPMVSYGITPV